MSSLKEAIDALRSNERQWEAFEEAAHCAVLAPPGSGKTKLLTTKLAHALATGMIVKPRGAACITLTNEAALELRRRLRELGVRRRPNLFVGTVHAFALSRIVMPLAAAAGRPDLAALRPATLKEYDAAFDEAFSKVGFRSYEKSDVRATTEKARQRLDLSGNRLLGGEPIAQTARYLQAALERGGVYDPQDLVRHAVELVENHHWVPRVLAATYPRVFVDEYQDLAPGLDRIVRGFTLPSELDSVLFAVGDPDQSIYAFSGAHPELLERLAAEPDVQEIRLERNYRSGQDLIDLSVRALGEKRVIRGERAGGSVEVHSAPGGADPQARAAVELVVRARAEGTDLDEIALIASWSQDRDRAVRELRAAGIPVFARIDEHWRTTRVTMALEALASWSMRRHEAGDELEELLEVFSIAAPTQLDHAVRASVVGVLLRAQPSALAHDFVEPIAATALLPYIADEHANEDARELARLRAALSADGPLENMTTEELAARARSPGHVMAATIHGAKGLEFDVVVMVGVDDACLPGFSPSPEERLEARRKFYVTLTRARERVHLVYTDSRVSRNGNRYGVVRSPFIAELGL